MMLNEFDQPVTPAILYENNIGAIFLTKNQQVSQRTKHISTRWHFTRHLVSQGFLSVRHVPSSQNYGDVMTKYLPAKAYETFTYDIHNGTIATHPRINKEDEKMENGDLADLGKNGEIDVKMSLTPLTPANGSHPHRGGLASEPPISDESLLAHHWHSELWWPISSVHGLFNGCSRSQERAGQDQPIAPHTISPRSGTPTRVSILWLLPIPATQPIARQRHFHPIRRSHAIPGLECPISTLVRRARRRLWLELRVGRLVTRGNRMVVRTPVETDPQQQKHANKRMAPRACRDPKITMRIWPIGRSGLFPNSHRKFPTNSDRNHQRKSIGKSTQ